MHLFPRTAGDVYVGYVIHHRVEFEQSTKDLEDLKTGIIAWLREAKRLAQHVKQDLAGARYSRGWVRRALLGRKTFPPLKC